MNGVSVDRQGLYRRARKCSHAAQVRDLLAQFGPRRRGRVYHRRVAPTARVLLAGEASVRSAAPQGVDDGIDPRKPGGGDPRCATAGSPGARNGGAAIRAARSAPLLLRGPRLRSGVVGCGLGRRPRSAPAVRIDKFTRSCFHFHGGPTCRLSPGLEVLCSLCVQHAHRSRCQQVSRPQQTNVTHPFRLRPVPLRRVMQSQKVPCHALLTFWRWMHAM